VYGIVQKWRRSNFGTSLICILQKEIWTIWLSAESHVYCTRLQSIFYILLTVHRVMILGKWPTWRTIIFYVFIYLFNSLHVSSTSCSSSGETNFVNTTSGSCHSVSVGVSCAGRKWTEFTYQRLYWHNLSLLMMSTMCSKHVQS